MCMFSQPKPQQQAPVSSGGGSSGGGGGGSGSAAAQPEAPPDPRYSDGRDATNPFWTRRSSANSSGGLGTILTSSSGVSQFAPTEKKTLLGQ